MQIVSGSRVDGKTGDLADRVRAGRLDGLPGLAVVVRGEQPGGRGAPDHVGRERVREEPADARDLVAARPFEPGVEFRNAARPAARRFGHVKVFDDAERVGQMEFGPGQFRPGVLLERFVAAGLAGAGGVEPPSLVFARIGAEVLVGDGQGHLPVPPRLGRGRDLDVGVPAAVAFTAGRDGLVEYRPEGVDRDVFVPDVGVRQDEQLDGVVFPYVAVAFPSLREKPRIGFFALDRRVEPAVSEEQPDGRLELAPHAGCGVQRERRGLFP